MRLKTTLKTIGLLSTALLSATHVLANNVEFSAADVAAQTFFIGTPQETDIWFQGIAGTANLQNNTPTVVSIGFYWLNSGIWTSSPVPSPEILTLTIPLTVGGEVVYLSRQVQLQQITGNQFQVDLFDSQTESINLGAGVSLEVTLKGDPFQFSTEAFPPTEPPTMVPFTGGSIVRAEMTLKGVPEASETLGLLAIGLLAVASFSRFPRARTA